MVIKLFEVVQVSPNIQCPNDHLAYSCTVSSTVNDYLQLIWRVTPPGELPISIIYDESSMIGDVKMLNDYISITLIEFNRRFTMSTLSVTLPENLLSVNLTKLECITSYSDKDTVDLILNSSGKYYKQYIIITEKVYSNTVPYTIPTNFKQDSEIPQGKNASTLTFNWNIPEGPDFGAVIDHTTIHVIPRPPYQKSIKRVEHPPWNITLEHNIRYTISAVFENCAGMSDVFILPVIIGKC